MARKRLGPDRQPWKGTYANEHLYNSVHNALVGIILDGVTGVSPNIGHHQIAPEKADEYLDRGRRVLTDFESQNIAPGGANGKTQRWMNHKIDELRRLVTDAEDVRSGKKPQKMTPADYEALRTHRPWTGMGAREKSPQRARAPRDNDRERSLDRLYGHTRGRDPYPFPSDRDRAISRLSGPKSGGAGAPTLMRPRGPHRRPDTSTTRRRSR